MPEAANTHTPSDVQPIPFLFDGDNLIRCIKQSGEPWFVAVDICRVLRITNAAQAVLPLDEDEKGICSTYTLGGIQDLLTVSEGGLYTLILRSRGALTPGAPAHKFRRWVVSDLLPSIRKTGRYDPTPLPARDPRENDNWKLKQVAEARLTFGCRAAAKVWIDLGLPTVPEMFVVAAQMEIPLDYGSPGSTSIN